MSYYKAPNVTLELHDPIGTRIVKYKQAKILPNRDTGNLIIIGQNTAGLRITNLWPYSYVKKLEILDHNNKLVTACTNPWLLEMVFNVVGDLMEVICPEEKLVK